MAISETLLHDYFTDQSVGEPTNCECIISNINFLTVLLTIRLLLRSLPLPQEMTINKSEEVCQYNDNQ
jgi:hypothetical protein